ncbi:hypothetical protein CXB51_025710 [Gossypium anomalum]|uniref:Uncharacterized protein n=1 Tax=Gossypium anomalum TaxID=47600 RepID=A0A8J5YEF1_9ROSI|nr:hypothetical protein CXB51_025710 [Gossypium anomalum]
MGCFLGCFGISTKRKRRKPANRILPGPADSKLVSYEPLDSSINVDIPEDSIVSKAQLSNKPKERSSVKIRKKVSFNLNVQTYEPIPDEETTTYQFLQSVEEKKGRKRKVMAEKLQIVACHLSLRGFQVHCRRVLILAIIDTKTVEIAMRRGG